MTQFKSGHKKKGGRQQGSTNKTTGELKGLISAALAKVGGVDYLVKQAENNPTAFLTLVGKILPKDINHDSKVDLKMSGDFVTSEARESIRHILELAAIGKTRSAEVITGAV